MDAAKRLVGKQSNSQSGNKIEKPQIKASALLFWIIDQTKKKGLRSTSLSHNHNSEQESGRFINGSLFPKWQRNRASV